MSTRRSRGIALACCYASMVALAGGVNLIPVLLTTLGVECGGANGLTNEQLGRIGAVVFAGLVVGILINGPLADRMGPRLFAGVGNLLMGAGLWLLAAAHSYAGVLAAAAVIGMGCGTVDMVMSPIVCALQPERRTAAMNWLHSFYCSGAVLTVLAGAAALRWGFAWRHLALLLALPPIVLAVAFVVLPLPRLVPATVARDRLRDLVRRPFFLAALAAIFLAGACELGMAQWLPAYAENALHLSKWISGIGLMGFSIGMAAGRIAIGMAGGRMNPWALLIGSAAATAACYVGACATPWPAFAFTACVASGIAVSCLWPTLLAAVGDQFPRGGASMFGMLSGCGNLGGIIMPWLIGAIADLSSLAWGLSTGIACALALATLLRWMRRHSAADSGEMQQVAQPTPS